VRCAAKRLQGRTFCYPLNTLRALNNLNVRRNLWENKDFVKRTFGLTNRRSRFTSVKMPITGFAQMRIHSTIYEAFEGGSIRWCDENR
jgi:hypothetical protein